MLAEAEKHSQNRQLMQEELQAAAQFEEIRILLGEDKKAFPEYQQARQEDIQASQDFHLIEDKFLESTIVKEEQIVEEKENKGSRLIQDHNQPIYCRTSHVFKEKHAIYFNEVQKLPILRKL